jgi:hypothetical protein
VIGIGGHGRRSEILGEVDEGKISGVIRLI